MREDNSSQGAPIKTHFIIFIPATGRHTPTIKPYIKFNITATVLILNDKITTVRNESAKYERDEGVQEREREAGKQNNSNNNNRI